MSRIDALNALLVKVEAGELSPRRLDAEVDAVLRIGTAKMRKEAQWAYNSFPNWCARDDKPGFCSTGEGGLWWKSERFTTSFDAAKALFDAVLPGWIIAIIGQDDNRMWLVELRRGYKTSFDKVALSKRTNDPARALLIAIIKALIAMELAT